MYERLSKCPLCKSGHFLNYLVVKDYAVTGESFLICNCKECSLLFTNPRPDKSSIAKYYESPEYISHSDQSTNLINFLYKAVRYYTIRQKVNWITGNKKEKGRILDFGCGTGYFLKALEKKGWETVGYEPNEKAAKTAASLHKLTPLTDLESLKNENKFDAITLFHVLEHVHELHPVLKLLVEKLKKRGTLYLAVPNLDSHDFSHYKETWAALDVPRHLYHFTIKSMDYLADKYNLKIIEKKPLYFDAYYVGMLTDKYQGMTNPFKSFLTAHKFNKQAKKSKTGYSSILYILKKK